MSRLDLPMAPPPTTVPQWIHTRRGYEVVKGRLPPYVVQVRNKVGRPYLYFQKGRGTAKRGQRVRLPDDPTSPEFWDAYARLVQLKPAVRNANAVGELARAWTESPKWAGMSDSTRAEWTRHVKKIVAHWGKLEVSGIEPKHVAMLRDEYAGTPATANNILRCLGSMIAWGIERGYRKDNPVSHVKQFPSGDGYAPWPWEVIEAVRETLRPDLWHAVALALYTGQRLADVLAMAWTALSRNGLTVRQGKTGKLLLIPVHRDLSAVLETIPRQAVTILTSSQGRPWTGDGFQSTWSKSKPAIVRDLGLVFHGLRKSAVVTLLEAGCTDAEVASITGQSRAMVEHYAKLVNQEKLARTAILKWERKLNA